MNLESLVFAVNTSGTFAIGIICLFFIYTTSRGLEDDAVKMFSRRLTISISVLILYVSYFSLYQSVLEPSVGTRAPLYMLLVVVFVMLMYTVVGFEEVASKHGINRQQKIDKMENESGV